MHSLICVDENGKPLAGMMTWADARSESIRKNYGIPTPEQVSKNVGYAGSCHVAVVQADVAAQKTNLRFLRQHINLSA